MGTKRTDSALRAGDQLYLELANRFALLTLHASIGITVGAAMFFTGAPAVVERDFGPWSRTVLGLWAVAFGISLLVGTLKTHFSPAGWVALISGCLGLAFWHSLIMFAYVDAAFDDRIAILMPGEHLDPSVTSRGYIPFIYLGYVTLVVTHAITVILLDRPRR